MHSVARSRVGRQSPAGGGRGLSLAKGPNCPLHDLESAPKAGDPPTTRPSCGRAFTKAQQLCLLYTSPSPRD
eukprot:6527887-Alexandrium_andersonii.AAC.1